MRKFILIMAVAFMGVFASCDCKSTTTCTVVENDSTAVDTVLVDSLVVDSVVVDSATVLN
jgi:hypothetical protein